MKRYDSLRSRLIAQTDEPAWDGGCWIWKGHVSKRYPRFSLRVDGVVRTFKAHRAMLVLEESGNDVALFVLLYKLYGYAGFDADHLCCNVDSALCINPEHLQWLPNEEHNQKPKRSPQRTVTAVRLTALCARKS